MFLKVFKFYHINLDELKVSSNRMFNLVNKLVFIKKNSAWVKQHCLNAECQVIFFCQAEYRYDECRYAGCLFVECHYVECLSAKCHYAECRYAESLCAIQLPVSATRRQHEFSTCFLKQFMSKKNHKNKAVFTTPHFHRSLQMGPISLCYITLLLGRLAWDTHSSLVGPYIVL